jgi:acyl-CoA thioesterase I
VRLKLAGLLAALCCLAACGTAAPAALPASLAKVVVTLGDSVPAGTACDCDPFPALYARAQHAVDENLAVAGYTSADVLTQVTGARDTLADADEVVLMIGANDLAAAFDDDTSYAQAAATMRANVAGAIDKVEAIRRTPVVVLGYWNVVRDGKVGADEYGPDGVRRAATATAYANDGLEQAAAQTGATYVSTDAAFHGPDGSRDPTSLLASDGDHPNAAGHAAIAALLPPLTRPAPTRSDPA